MNTILLSISALSFLSYTIWLFTKGLDYSYSHSYYMLKHKWVFPVFILTYAVPLSYLFDKPLTTLAAGLIGTVAFAANFLGNDGAKGTEDDNKIVYWMHMIGSTAGVVLFYISGMIYFGRNYTVLSCVLFLVVLSLYSGLTGTKRKILWIEMGTMLYVLLMALNELV